MCLAYQFTGSSLAKIFFPVYRLCLFSAEFFLCWNLFALCNPICQLLGLFLACACILKCLTCFPLVVSRFRILHLRSMIHLNWFLWRMRDNSFFYVWTFNFLSIICWRCWVFCFFSLTEWVIFDTCQNKASGPVCVYLYSILSSILVHLFTCLFLSLWLWSMA